MWVVNTHRLVSEIPLLGVWCEYAHAFIVIRTRTSFFEKTSPFSILVLHKKVRKSVAIMELMASVL